MSATGYANSEFVEQAQEQAIQDKQERAVEAVENFGTKQWLESKLEEQAKPVEIFDREFRFRPIGSETTERVLELASEEAANTPDVDADNLDDVDPDEMESLPALLREMREVLAEHCLNDEMDREAFGMLPPQDLMKTFEQVAMSEGMNQSERERVDQFRN